MNAEPVDCWQRFESIADQPSPATASPTASAEPATPAPSATFTSEPPTATATPTPIPLCNSTPIACKVSGLTKLTLKNSADDTKDRMKFKWAKGAATTFAELGDPTVGTQYSLCVWDHTAGMPSLVMEAVALPGGNCVGRPCWRRIGTDRGYRYKDPGGLPHGLQQIVVKTGTDGRAIVSVKGRGGFLPDPPMPFDQDTKITVQVINSDGACWGSDFLTAAAKNDSSALVVKERP